MQGMEGAPMRKKRAEQAASDQPKYMPNKAAPIYLHGEDETTYGKQASAQVVSPEMVALRVVSAGESKVFFDEIDNPGMLAHLREQATAINSGDMKQAEAMLMNQATALQSLFAKLVEKSMAQSHMPNLEGFMRLALRAQNQCRATLETLATIKNPPIIYAKQLNQTTGPQQINNGATATAHGRENEIDQNELTGGGNELLPDTGTPGDAGRAMPARPTLEKFNRP
ncbi:MAG: hypothetical protein WCC44_13525 [Azonexus sp.]